MLSAKILKNNTRISWHACTLIQMSHFAVIPIELWKQMFASPTFLCATQCISIIHVSRSLPYFEFCAMKWWESVHHIPENVWAFLLLTILFALIAATESVEISRVHWYYYKFTLFGLFMIYMHIYIQYMHDIYSMQYMKWAHTCTQVRSKIMAKKVLNLDKKHMAYLDIMTCITYFNTQIVEEKFHILIGDKT